MVSKIVAVAALGLALALSSPHEARSETMGDWAGPYAGVYAGYAFGRADATSAFDSNTGFFYNWTGRPYGFDADGWLAGGTLGHNWQRGVWVAGVEAEIGYFDLQGAAIDPNHRPGFPHIPDTETKVGGEFHASLYGRVGRAIGPALFYLKAGGTLLNAKASTVDPCCGSTLLWMYGNKTMLGWTAGGGVEWAVNPRWTVKFDYAYFDFGRIETAGPSSEPNEFYRQHIDVTAHAIKVGVNRRFAGPMR
jgi:outer membrane immunogenic protein